MTLVFPTCTFLGAAGSLAMHPQLAAEVFLPELGEPDVPAVVGQRATLEVTVERCGKKETLITVMVSLRTSSGLCSGLLHDVLLRSPFPASPSTDALLGRMVMAPSATRSCWTTGEILEPQLSEPTHRK